MANLLILNPEGFPRKVIYILVSRDYKLNGKPEGIEAMIISENGTRRRPLIEIDDSGCVFGSDIPGYGRFEYNIGEEHLRRLVNEYSGN